MKRKIIQIDEEKCDGCGLCIPECKEGALQVIDGKARLISDLFCDGLGACIGHCPQNAITIEEREAEAYDEIKVLEQIGRNTNVLRAHLKHLLDHDDHEHYNEAVDYLSKKGIDNPFHKTSPKNGKSDALPCGCPGTMVLDLSHQVKSNKSVAPRPGESQLGQWPVQLHLVPPSAPYFRSSELVIMSTCGPLASANVHEDYLQGRSVVVACPKLDNTGPYTAKLAQIFSQAHTPKAIVVIMEVPCCGGLSKIALDAARASGRKDLTIEQHILGIDGKLKHKSYIFDESIELEEECFATNANRH